MRKGIMFAAATGAIILAAGATILLRYDRSWARCTNNEPDVRIGGCTAIIEAGRDKTNNLAIAFYNRGLAYIAKRQYDRAIRDFDQATKLQPNSFTAYYTYYNRGLAYASKSQFDRAIEDFDKAIKLNPNDALAFAAYYARGMAYYITKQFDRAIEDFDKAIKRNPNDALAFAAYYNRGIAYSITKQFDRAIEDLDQAIKLNPNDALAFDGYYNRGMAYASKSQFDRAIEDFDKAIKLNPNCAPAFNERGLAYYSKGQYDRAIEDFDQAVKIDPNHVRSLRNRRLAENAKRGTNPVVAEQAATQTLDQQRCFTDRISVSQIAACTAMIQSGHETQENLAKAFLWRGQSYAFMAHAGGGQYDRAIQDYDQSIRLNPNDALAFYARGTVYMLMGQQDRAMQDFNQYYSIAGGP